MASFMAFFRGDADHLDHNIATHVPSGPPDYGQAIAGQPPLTDKAKWARSKARWDVTVTPADEKFRTIYSFFVERLKTLSPEAVVREGFSNFEVRKFLTGFVDKTRFNAIHEQQKLDKKAYRDLIADGATFATASFPADIANPAPLPRKLAMLHFGLPVEPMTFADPMQMNGSELFSNLHFASTFQDDDEDFDDEDLSFVPEQLRPMRHLNYYDRRGHGKDNSHMSAEKTYELFYGIPMVVPTKDLTTGMSLRGAGVDDASDEEDSAMGHLSGELITAKPDEEETTTSVVRVSPHIALHGTSREANAGEQVYIWGLSGRTTFSYFDAKSFFLAIDRLLGLSKRGDDLGSVGITVTLLSHPKGQRSPCTVLASDQCFLGRSEEDELNFHKTWLETVQFFDDQVEDGQALDICVAQISQDIHFSESQEALAYRPSLEDDKVVSFSLSGDEADSLSYLSMTDIVNEKTPASHYQTWFKSLWRTLSRPNAEQLKTYSVGSRQALAPQSCLVNITTCGETGEGEVSHWFHSDAGPTPELWKWFIDACQKKRHRVFVLHAIPTTDPRASSIIVSPGATSVATLPETVDTIQGEERLQFYWGCYNQHEDTIAFMQTDGPMKPVPLNPLGRPDNGTQMDDFAKGKAFREWSYAHPLSINMQGQQPTIPINAPPLEVILKTPGINGRAAESLPVMSTAVLTPSEQRHLQETVFEMRSLALNRAQPCPFRPCRMHFPIDEDGRTAFREHIQAEHIDKHCPLCDDRNFGYWDTKQKQVHFYEEHAGYFSQQDDLYRNTVFSVESEGNTDTREEKWNFCARCGRDHNTLNVKGDRTQHDNMCYPGVDEQSVWLRFCVKCGELETEEDEWGVVASHHCASVEEEDPTEVDATPVHCSKCALKTHLLSRPYAETHLARCMGVHHNPAHYCPWCGTDLSIHPMTKACKHLDECRLKPAGGEGPMNTALGEPYDSPWDNRARRSGVKESYTANGQSFVVDVPMECVFIDCDEDVSKLNARALLEHYGTIHQTATSNLSTCPFCALDFLQRGWAEEHEKVGHFQDHIEQRVKRIEWDFVIASTPNKQDPALVAQMKLRDADEFSTATSAPETEQQITAILGQLKSLQAAESARTSEAIHLRAAVGNILQMLANVEADLSEFFVRASQTPGPDTGKRSSDSEAASPNKKPKLEDIEVSQLVESDLSTNSGARSASDDKGPSGGLPLGVGGDGDGITAPASSTPPSTKVPEPRNRPSELAARPTRRTRARAQATATQSPIPQAGPSQARTVESAVAEAPVQMREGERVQQDVEDSFTTLEHHSIMEEDWDGLSVEDLD